MEVITRRIRYESRSDRFTIIPIGDVHVGNIACDEGLLRDTVKRIETDPLARWIGLGDYCEFINRSDPRFVPNTLASWLLVKDLGDLAEAQKNRFLDIVKPIASKCLAMLSGNHETAIAKHYERNIYLEIVTAIKEAGGFAPEDKLAIGYYGWLKLQFSRRKDKGSTETFTLNLHHGFGGGRLAGSKALSMQRWLWTHDADVVLFGHTHDTYIQSEVVESIDAAGKVVQHKRIGAICGSFLKSYALGATTYNEQKGYLPLGTGGVAISIRPDRGNPSSARPEREAARIRVETT